MATTKAAIPDPVAQVLGYREDGDWVALALEMDLRGHGKSFEEALDDLSESVSMQISFAHSKGQPDMIWRPAEPIYFQLFSQVRNQLLHEAFQRPRTDDYAVGGLPLPPNPLMAGDDFQQADG